MTRYLLDSGIASAYINRRSGVYERAQTEVKMATCSESVYPYWLNSFRESNEVAAANATCEVCGWYCPR